VTARRVRSRRPALFWLSLLAGFGVLLWLLSSILAPFVLGMAMAYLVDPLVGRLERLGLSRATVSGGIIIAVFGSSALVLALLVPVLVEQVTGLAARLPDLVAWAHQAVVPLANGFMSRIGAPSSAVQVAPTAEVLQHTASIAGDLLRRFLARGLALVNLLSLLCLTPLVAFYLLRD